MEARKLMMGNWVQVPSLIDNVEHFDAWCQVKQLRDCDLDVIGFKEIGYDEIVPIPLTTEILEKNGFKECETNQLSYYKYEDDDSTKRSLYHILWSADEPYLAIASYTEGFGEFYRIGIKYVHELQNALSICNIDLKIEI